MGQLFTQTCTNQTTSLLVCSWSIFGARMSHRHTQIHKTHHGLDSGEATTSPYSILYAWPQGLHPNVILSQDSQVGGPKILNIPKIRTPTTLEAHNVLFRPQIEVIYLKEFIDLVEIFPTICGMPLTRK